MHEQESWTSSENDVKKKVKLSDDEVELRVDNLHLISSLLLQCLIACALVSFFFGWRLLIMKKIESRLKVQNQRTHAISTKLCRASKTSNRQLFPTLFTCTKPDNLALVSELGNGEEKKKWKNSFTRKPENFHFCIKKSRTYIHREKSAHFAHNVWIFCCRLKTLYQKKNIIDLPWKLWRITAVSLSGGWELHSGFN